MAKNPDRSDKTGTAAVVVNDARGAVLSVKVVPGASRSRIMGRHGNSLKICISAAPEKGAANAELLELLAQAIGVRVADLSIVSGQTGPNKRVAITGRSATQVAAQLALES